MTKKESINRNIGLTFDFLRQVVKDPSLLDKLSDSWRQDTHQEDPKIKNFVNCQHQSFVNTSEPSISFLKNFEVNHQFQPNLDQQLEPNDQDSFVQESYPFDLQDSSD